MGRCVSYFLLLLFFLNYCIAIKSFWHSYKFGTGVGNREELVITDFKLNDRFNYGENITRWESTSIGDNSYAAGFTETRVVFITATLNKENSFNFSSIVLDVNNTISDIKLMLDWNPISEKYDVIIIVATEGLQFVSHLRWFRVENDNIIYFWTWTLYERILLFIQSEVNGSNKLFAIAQRETGSIFLSVYDFTLKSATPDFWLSQNVHLDYPTKISALTFTHGGVFLSVAQRESNQIIVYKYEENRLVSFQNISRADVSSLYSFKIASKSFIAVGGKDPGIFRFSERGLMREFIPGFNEDQIETWFPVAVRTYRDEVLLIIERHIFHSDSHDSLSYEALVFNGRHFAFHDEMSCFYFGENMRGLSCLNEKGENGIFGSAVMTIRNKVGILVPRSVGSSEFFEIDLTLKDLPSPVDVEVQKLEEIRKALDEAIDLHIGKTNPDVRARGDIDEEDTSIKEIPVIDNSDRIENFKVENFTLEDIKRRLDFAGKSINEMSVRLKNAVRKDQKEIHIKELIVNGSLEVLGETNTDVLFLNKINDEPAHAAFNDIVNKKEINTITGPKTISDIEVKNISFKLLNNKDADDIAFNDGSPLLIRGDIQFENTVKVQNNVNVITKKVNDLILEDNIVTINSTHKGILKFNNLIISNFLNSKLINDKEVHINTINSDKNTEDILFFDTLNLKGNLTVENINDINFNKFIGSLCFKNLECFVDGNFFIDGTIIGEHAEIQSLNSLKFPNEYLFRNSENFLTITGTKNFTNSLIANEFNVRNKINGIDPKSILTHSTNQNLPGKYIFSNMKVLEKIKVDGKMTNSQAENILKNPRLIDDTEINSKINFKNLEVQGKIIISENFNGKPFQSSLQDVLYKDDKEAKIDSIKTFPLGFTVDKGLKVLSNKIKDISLDSFVTKDTEQELIFSTINGDVSINNLHISGLYENINITEMSQEAVRLSGNQFISAELIFNSENNNLTEDADMIVNELEVLNYFNGNSVHSIVNEDREVIYSDDVIDELRAENIEIVGSITSDNLNWNLKNLDENRLSISKDQHIFSDFKVKVCDVEAVTVDNINNIPYSKLFDPQSYINFITQELVAGNVHVKDMEVDNLESSIINNFHLNVDFVNQEFIVSNVSFNKELTLLDNLFIKTINIKKFNSVPFDLFASNIVYKDEDNITLKGRKVYENGCQVKEKIYTDHINGVPVDDILTKNDQQDILGPIHVFGNVLVTTDCEIKNTLNDVPITTLKSFRVENENYVITGDVIFERETFIDNLFAKGTINQVNFEDIIDSLRGHPETSKLMGNVTFKETAHIRGNLLVSNTINNHDFGNLLDNMVFKHVDNVVYGAVLFKQSVEIKDTLYSDQNLESRFIFDVDLKNWIDHAVKIDRGYIPANLQFEEVFIKGDLKVDYIDNIDMKKLILTKTDEDLNINLTVGEVSFFNDVFVENLVNGYYLPEEYEHSFMVNGNQEVTCPVVFHGAVTVTGNLNVLQPIDGQDLQKIVTLNTDQNLTAKYVFKNEVEVSSELKTYGHVNGFDFESWNDPGLKKFQNTTQNVDEEWIIKGEINFNSKVDGGGLISGINITEMAHELQLRKKYFEEKNFGMVEATRNVCKDVNYITAAARKQIYYFKYVEELKEITTSILIDTVHHFKHEKNHYLVVHEKNSCFSEIYQWENSGFTLIGQIETGEIDFLITVYDPKIYFIVTNAKSESGCKFTGTNLWKFQDYQFTLLHKLPDQSKIESSLKPRTFYGLNKNSAEVNEYYIIGNDYFDIKTVTKWSELSSNDSGSKAFVPRGLGTGLAVYGNKSLYKLVKTSKSHDEFYEHDYESVSRGFVLIQENCCLPKPGKSSEIQFIHTGIDDSRKTMVAVSFHEEISVKGKWDHIKIYEDILNGKIFHKISTYKPSSLTSIEFGNNGESLLAFLENDEVLQIYEYKGIEGFQNRLSKQMKGKQILHFSIRETEFEEKKYIILVGDSTLKVLEIVMEGNQLNESDIEC